MAQREPSHHACLWFLGFFCYLLFLPGLSFSLPPTERMVLKNGLRLVVSEDHSLPFVTFQLIIDGGSRLDPSGKEGLSYLTAKGLLHGTAGQTAQQMSRTLDFMGANLSSGGSKDYISVGLKIMKKDLAKGVNIFMDALAHPVFPEEELRREIQRTLGAIKSMEEDPGGLSEKEFEKAVYSATPYYHPAEGTEESLPRLRRDDLVWFHDAYVRPNGAILVIVGDVTLHEIKKDFFDLLEAWPSKVLPQASFDQTPASGVKRLALNRSITQANIILGGPGPKRNNPDFFPMIVMNYILGGGGFSSRLLNEVRAKRGLAYSVHSGFDFKKFTGSFSVSLQTKNASAKETISVVLEELRKIQREPVTEKELDGARKYLTGSFPLRFDTQAKLAGFLAQVEFYGLGADYADTYASHIRAVTKEDIQRVAKKHLNPDNYFLVVVGNLSETGFGK